MSEANHFFRWVHRILALGAVALMVLIAYVLISEWLKSSHRRGRNTVEVAADGAEGRPAPRQLRFYGLETLKGTGMQILKVADRNGGGAGRVMSSYSAPDTDRNIVFLGKGYSQARWLFPKNDQVIRSVDEWCACESAQQARILALYLEVASSDTNGDGTVDDDDLGRPALVKPDGSRYTVLFDKPVRILGHEFDSQALGLLFQQDGNLMYRQYAPDTFAMVSEQLVTRLSER